MYRSSPAFFLLALATACCLGLSTRNLSAVTFDWATVGNPGNPADQLYPSKGNPNNLQFGAVSDTYRISKHEVTNDQYAEFLNTVAASDPNSLFNERMDIARSGSSGSFTYMVNSGFGSNPVNFVSFFDSMRFVNWLENGQGSGSTELGVYTIGDGFSETRDASATFFIPSEDEWYKAAFYDPRSASAGGPAGDDNYWLYPTRSDIRPNAEGPPGGTNSANYRRTVGNTTDVGAYLNTTSFYGTFDQAGNVFEWNEAVLFSFFRGFRGGSWLTSLSFASSLGASRRRSFSPTLESTSLGFRVASVPEPSTSLLFGLASLLMFSIRRRWER